MVTSPRSFVMRSLEREFVGLAAREPGHPSIVDRARRSPAPCTPTVGTRHARGCRRRSSATRLRATTTAVTDSPRSACGTPNTNAKRTSGNDWSTVSTSSGDDDRAARLDHLGVASGEEDGVAFEVERSPVRYQPSASKVSRAHACRTRHQSVAAHAELALDALGQPLAGLVVDDLVVEVVAPEVRAQRLGHPQVWRVAPRRHAERAAASRRQRHAAERADVAHRRPHEPG